MLHEHFGIFGRVKLSRMSSKSGGPLIALARMAKTWVLWHISVSVDEVTWPSGYRFSDVEKQYWLIAALIAAAQFQYSLTVSGRCRKSQRSTAWEV